VSKFHLPRLSAVFAPESLCGYTWVLYAPKEVSFMSERERYTVEVAGLTRHLPLFEVAPGVRIAIFNMLGDTYVAKAAAAALAERLKETSADVLLTAEAKSMPLVYEMSALMGLPYVVLRKNYKTYMGDALSAETVSITTGKKQTLYLDEKDYDLVHGMRVIIVDDVISTGSTLRGMEKIVAAAGATVSRVAAVFTEGDQDSSAILALGNLPVFQD
jgi:adenine phosphoribosyltransferase